MNIAASTPSSIPGLDPVALPSRERRMPGHSLRDYDDLTLAQENLAETQSQLAEERSAMLCLQAKICQLESLERECFAEVETASARVASKCTISKLYDDILLSIFLHLPQEARWESVYPWLLQAVNKRWRKVCLDNPRLWSYFSFSAGHCCRDEERYDFDDVARTLLQLDRCRDVSLFILLGRFCDCPTLVSQFHALAERSSRWEAVEFYDLECGPTAPITDSRFLRDLIHSNSRFTELREITWREVYKDTAEEDINEMDLPLLHFGPLKKLDTLRLDRFRSLKASGQLPWAQLTSLTITAFHGEIRDILVALSQCQLLHLLKLSVDGGQLTVDHDALSMNIITLPLLAELDIVQIYGDYTMAHVVPWLQLPSLRSLSVTPKFSLHPIIDLIKRSSCSLQNLKLIVINSREQRDAASSLWRLCPDLRTLEYQNSVNASADAPHLDAHEVVQSLVSKGSSDVPCPQLRELRFTSVKLNPVLVNQMVISRFQANNIGLRKLAISYKMVLQFPMLVPVGVSLPRTAQNTTSDSEYEFFKGLLEQSSKTWHDNLELEVSTNNVSEKSIIAS